MKKAKKFEGMNPSEVAAKQQELINELVRYRVSMDPSCIKMEGGVSALSRELKAVSRKHAINSMNKKN